MRKILVIEKLVNGDTTAVEAGKELGLSKRQILRLKKRYLSEGAKGCIHKNKGKVPKHAIGKIVKEKVLEVFMDWKRETDEGAASQITERLPFSNFF
ncbi:MAG: helix-turn-helix domain-containing protein [Pseudobdellovibrionaceae bacterium]